MKQKSFLSFYSIILALGALSFKLKAEKIQLEKEGKSLSALSRTTRDFVFNDKKNQLEWYAGSSQKGFYPYSLFQFFGKEQKKDRYYVKVRLFKESRGRDLLIVSSKDQVQIDKFFRKMQKIEVAVSLQDIKAATPWFLQNKKEFLGELSRPSVVELNDKIADIVNKSKADSLKKVAKGNKIKVVTGAKVQDRMIEFAQDNRATGNLHLQMAASQFNGAEHLDYKDLAIPKHALDYVIDNTQGPGTQLANPYTAEDLRAKSFTSKNTKGFHGFKKQPFYNPRMGEGHPFTDEFIKNGYLIYKEGEINRLYMVEKENEHIRSTAATNMPVLGKALNTQQYFYKPGISWKSNHGCCFSNPCWKV